MRKFFYTILLVLITGIHCFSQKVKRYNIASGLPDISCISLKYDANGLLWIGTQAGLCVYNGSEFESIPTGDSKKGTKGLIIHKIRQLKDNCFFLLSIAVEKGDFMDYLEIYDPKNNCSKEVSLKKRNVITSKNTERWGAIEVDDKSNLWALSSKFKAYCYNYIKGDSVSYNLQKYISDTISTNHAFGFVTSEKLNNLYFYFDNGLLELGKNISNKNYHKIKNETISGTLSDLDFIWVFTISGNIYQFDTKNKTYNLKFKNIPGLNPTVFSATKNSTEIILGGNAGIVRLNLKTGKYQTFANNPIDNNSLSSNVISSLTFDKENNLWIGTPQSGLNCIPLKENKFKLIEIITKEGKDVEVFQGFQEGKNWILASSEGLINYDLTTKNYSILIKTPPIIAELESNLKFTTVFKDLNGNYWYGGFDFLFMYNPISKATRNLKVEKLKEVMFLKAGAYEQFNKSEIWMVLSGGGIGRYFYEDNSFTIYNYPDKLPESQNMIFELEYGNGHLWASSNSAGVLEYDGKNDKFIKLKFEDNSTALDMKWINNSLWIGSFFNKIVNVNEAGNKIVNSYSSGKPTIYGVKSMATDSKKNIWFSTFKGIGHFNVSTQQYSFMDNQENIPFIELGYKYDMCLGKNKTLMIGQPNGFIVWSENVFSETGTKANVLITQVEINETKIEPNKIGSTSILQNKFNLDYSKNNISISFSGLELLNATKIMYRYRLIGLNSKWINCNNQKSINYSGLNPGKYQFNVSASVDGLIWSSPAKLFFIISPPWWETWFFRITAIIIVLILIYSIYKWRISSILRRQTQLEKIVEERTAEVIHQKDIIEEKQKEVMDSIRYAKRIQQALLPSEKFVSKTIKKLRGK